MKQVFVAFALAVTLVGCVGPGGPVSVLDQQKASLQFCNTYVGTMQYMIVYRSQGLLSDAQVESVNTMATIVGPHCSQPVPPPPSNALIALLDAVVLMQLQKAQGAQ